MRSQSISDKEKRMLQTKFEMYKKRISRRLSKLAAWTDINPGKFALAYVSRFNKSFGEFY